jgi:hypothetical protein
MDDLTTTDLTRNEQRGVNKAAALAKEQFRYAQEIARDGAAPGQAPDPVLVAGVVQAIALNYAQINGTA